MHVTGSVLTLLLATADALRLPPSAKCDVAGWARRTVAEQLAPWNTSGITEEMVNNSLAYAPKTWNFKLYQMKNGTLIADGNLKGGGFWADYMRRAMRFGPFKKTELKDFKVVVGSGDWPLFMKGDPRADPKNNSPAFAQANNGNFYDIVMPCSEREEYWFDYEEHRKKALAIAKNSSWRNRKDTAVWRGALGCSVGCGTRGAAYFPNSHLEEKCVDDDEHWNPNYVGFTYGCGDDSKYKQAAWMKHPRVELVKRFAQASEQCDVDVGFHSLNDHTKFVKKYTEPESWIKSFMDDAETANYRYVFNVGNNGYADRSWRMFALGSVVLMVDDGWHEFYHSFLKPWVHYIPVKGDASDVCEKLKWARSHPNDAEKIANNGRKFIEECMTEDFVNVYIAELMRQLGMLWELGQK